MNGLARDGAVLEEKSLVDMTSIVIDGKTLEITGDGEQIINGLFHSMQIDTRDIREEFMVSNECIYDNMTLFFTLLHMDRSRHREILSTCHKLLKDGGKLYIWDVELGKRRSTDEEYFELPLLIHTESQEIEKIYKVPWSGNHKSISYLVKLFNDIGFTMETIEKDQTFCLILHKREK